MKHLGEKQNKIKFILKLNYVTEQFNNYFYVNEQHPDKSMKKKKNSHKYTKSIHEFNVTISMSLNF